MKIIAIDPGPHIGVAMRKEDGDAIALMVHNELELVMDLVMEFAPDVIAVERFATGGRLSVPGTDTIEIVGAMRALAHILGAKFYKRMPQQRYAFMDQSKKDLGKKRTQHEYDAYAHLLSWEYFEQERLESSQR